MRNFAILSPIGTRIWQADDADHAREQHIDLFGIDDPDEKILAIADVGALMEASVAVADAASQIAQAVVIG
jgi:hypothetical protein